MAGATGAVLVLPQGVAFAAIAGMPPEYGVYAAIVPTIVAALFGSSWHLMGGPTTATSIVIFSTMSTVAPAGTAQYVELVLVMSLIAGVFKLLMGLLRLGVLVNFVSNTVVIGFTAGAGLLIAASQLQHLFAVPVPHGGLIETLAFFSGHVADIDWYVASIGIITLLTAVELRRRYPQFPYMIGAMAAGGIYAYLLRYIPGFSASHHIATVPPLPGPIPSLSAPHVTLEAIRKTASAAVVVAIVGLTEALSIARAIARRSEQRIDANQEFIGQGLATIAGSFFSSYAASGSLNRSGLNYEAGAKTPLAAVFSALFLVIALVILAPLAQYLPLAALAGILLLIGWGLIDVASIRKIARLSRTETVVLTVTFLATLFVQLGFAIYTGVILSLMLYLMRTAQPRLTPVQPDSDEHQHLIAVTGLSQDPARLRMVRLRGSIFFGAANYVQDCLRRIDADSAIDKHLLVDASGMNFIDAAGAEVLAREALRRRRLGGALYLYRVNDEVRRVLARTGRIAEVGKENILEARPRTAALH